MSNKVSFREFMDQVEAQLKTYSLDALREIILEWARNTHPAKRSEFLNNLVYTPASPQPQEPDNDLLAEINKLAKRVKNGEYSQGWGWDDEIQEERDFGDESWADEADEFFDRAYESMTAGHYKIARDGYARLFDILEMGQEPGHLPGSLDPQDMLDTDLGEARACYLRSVYLSSPPPERPAQMLEAIRRFSYEIGDELNMRRILDIERDPLPDLALFLPGWIDRLKKTNLREASYLLREATIMSGGTPAIAGLARNEGKRYPRAYIDWIKALEEKGDFRSMYQAAREGLANVPADYVTRAEIAEGLARAGERLQDIEAQLAGWHEAFYSHPTLSHLLSLLVLGEQKGRFNEEVEFALARIAQLIKKGLVYREHPTLEDADLAESTACGDLLNQAYLLARKYEDAFSICEDRESLGWVEGDPEEIVLPFFLVLLSRKKNPDAVKIVKRVWNEAVSRIREYSNSQQNTQERFLAAMDRVFKSIRLSEDEQVKYQSWAMEKVSQVVSNTMRNQSRESYDKAANLVVALAEMVASRSTKSGGIDLVEQYRRKYSRYSAFQKELVLAIKESKIYMDRFGKT